MKVETHVRTKRHWSLPDLHKKTETKLRILVLAIGGRVCKGHAITPRVAGSLLLAHTISPNGEVLAVVTHLSRRKKEAR